MSDFDNRKEWQNPYSSKHFKDAAKHQITVRYPTVSSLPENKWVIPRKPAGFGQSPHTYQKLWEEIDAWLVTQKIKHRKSIVESQGALKTVYVFKKTKVTVLFKLTWG